MRIATFNANSIRVRAPLILEFMERDRIDVLCVQETKVEDGVFPAEPFRAAGYHLAFRGRKSYEGVALVCRQEPRHVEFGLDDGGPADEPRLLRARIGPLSIVNTYVPQGRALDHPMYAYKLEWLKRLRGLFDRHYKPEQLLLWAGDMNVAQEPRDVHHPADHEQHVCYHRSAREAFRHCVDWGFEDVFRRFHPEEGLYSFYDYRVKNAIERGLGWRIDCLMASTRLASRCIAAEIDLEARRREKPSDHTIMWADFDI